MELIVSYVKILITLACFIVIILCFEVLCSIEVYEFNVLINKFVHNTAIADGEFDDELSIESSNGSSGWDCCFEENTGPDEKKLEGRKIRSKLKR